MTPENEMHHPRGPETLSVKEYRRHLANLRRARLDVVEKEAA